MVGMSSNANKVVKIKLQSRLNSFSSAVEYILTDRITERLLSVTIDREKIQIPQNLKLADPDLHRCSDIDMLIGIELFWQLICVGQIKLSQAHPMLQKIHFGWIVAGHLNGNMDRARGHGVGTFHVSVIDSELQNQLSRFWQLEEGFRQRDSYSSVERFCEQHFFNNVKRDERGRMIVTLPIKEHKLRTLSETRDIALRHFHGLEKRLDRNPNLKGQYKAFMHEYFHSVTWK